MTTLLLIRHGETDWNLEGRWQGQVDIPLNERGQAQAHQIAERLNTQSIQAIYSSDLRRSYETAEFLASFTDLPIHTDKRLREIHQGEWQGMRVREIEEKYNQRFLERRKDAHLVAPPGGETTEQVHTRVIAAIEEIRSQHMNETIAVFSHGFAIAVARMHYTRQQIELVWELVPKNGEIITLQLNPQ